MVLINNFILKIESKCDNNNELKMYNSSKINSNNDCSTEDENCLQINIYYIK